MFASPDDFDLNPPYSIPNLDKVENTFVDFVDREEEEILRQLMGDTMYEAFIDGVEELPSDWVLPEDPLIGYILHDTVLYKGIVYQSMIDVNNDTPGETANWLLISEWLVDGAYVIGDLIVSVGIVYQALADSIGVIPSSDISVWEPKFDYKWLKLRDGSPYGQTRRWFGVKKMLIPYIYSEWVADGWDHLSGIGVVQGNAENSKVISPKRRIANSWNEFAHIAGNGCSKRNTLYGFCKANEDLYPDFAFGDPGRMNILNV